MHTQVPFKQPFPQPQPKHHREPHSVTGARVIHRYHTSCAWITQHSLHVQTAPTTGRSSSVTISQCLSDTYQSDYKGSEEFHWYLEKYTLKCGSRPTGIVLLLIAVSSGQWVNTGFKQTLVLAALEGVDKRHLLCRQHELYNWYKLVFKSQWLQFLIHQCT